MPSDLPSSVLGRQVRQLVEVFLCLSSQKPNGMYLGFR